MPKKRFSAEQIVTVLRQIEVSMAQGMSGPTTSWRPRPMMAASSG